MNPQTYRNWMVGQGLCTLYFALMLAMAEIEGAGVQRVYLALLTMSAVCGIGLILAWRRRPRLATVLGGSPAAILALLIAGAALAPHGLVS